MVLKMVKDGEIINEECRRVTELIPEKCPLDLVPAKPFVISVRGVSVENLAHQIDSCRLRSG